MSIWRTKLERGSAAHHFCYDETGRRGRSGLEIQSWCLVIGYDSWVPLSGSSALRCVDRYGVFKGYTDTKYKVVMENTKSPWVKHTLWSAFPSVPFSLFSPFLFVQTTIFFFFIVCSGCVFSVMSCRFGAKTMRICGGGTCMCSPLTRALEALHRSLVTSCDAK